MIRLTWEVSRLEETQNQTKRDQNNPVVDEAKADLHLGVSEVPET